MGWEEPPRANTPPRGGSPADPGRRATTPPRGPLSSTPHVASRATALNAGFGSDVPVVIGTVVDPQSPTSRTRLSRAGDELSDAAVDFGAIQTMRQPRPSDVVIGHPWESDTRLCGMRVTKGRAFCGIGCACLVASVGVLLIVGGLSAQTEEESEEKAASVNSLTYAEIPLAAEIPTSSPHVELELRAEMPEGSIERQEFELNVIQSAAAVMQISAKRIAILDIRQASGGRRRQLQSDGLVLVMLGIVPAEEGERSAATAVAMLANAVESSSGALTGVLSGARVTASGNMLGERNGRTCSVFVTGRFYDCATMVHIYNYDCSCTCDSATSQPLPQVQWTTIPLKGHYRKPVVVVSPVTSNDIADAHVRVRQVSSQSFQLALQESSCLDQAHEPETVSWMVVEAGSWNVDFDVPTFEADTVAIAPGYHRERWHRVPLSEHLQVPVVVSHLMTSNEGHTSSWSRLANLNSFGFDIALEEASWDGFHAAEVCGWVAFEAGSSRAGAFLFDAGRSDVVGGTSSPTEIRFSQPFEATPLVFSSIISTHACCSDVGLRCDGDTSALRMAGTSSSSAFMRVKEMDCSLQADQPDIHDMDENVATIAMATDGASSSGSMIAPVQGCDDEPDGKQLDQCGVCGGDGSSCQCWSHISKTDVTRDYKSLSQMDGSERYSLSDDGLTDPIDIGFSFNFYSTSYTSVRVSANGYLHFGAQHTPNGNTWPIPSVNHPNNIAAVLWTDLDPSRGGEIRGWGNQQMKVFEWSNVRLWQQSATVTASNTFEVQLLQADNSMRFLYSDVSVSTSHWDETHAAVTIGVEDATGESGVEIEYSFDVNMQFAGVNIPEECHAVSGCDGVPGSQVQDDVCGECGGEGTSCAGCMAPGASNFDPTASIPDICTWDICTGYVSAELTEWGGFSQFVAPDFTAAVAAGSQDSAVTFGHAFIDEYGLTMDGSGDYAMIAAIESCAEAAQISNPVDAANCLGVSLGQSGSQADCEAVMTEADPSVRACTYVPGLSDYSADGSFTITFWFSKVICDPGSQYEYLWSHTEQQGDDILSPENSNVNLYLSCSGYGAFGVAEGGPGEGSAYLRTNLVDSVGERANWDSLLHVDGFDAITEQWVNIIMSFSLTAIETWVDKLADHDFTHHVNLQSCTDNAAYPDPTALNTQLAGFSLSDAPLYIGGRADLSPDRHFRGTVAGAAVYGHTMQAAEVVCNWEASETAIPLLPDSFYGCTDQFASNYEPEARVAADTCTYPPPCFELRDAEWVDATGGDRHELDDDAHVQVDLPFSFSWFAETYDFVKIASNGFITFGDGDLPEDGTHVFGAHARTHRAPDPAPPNNAAFAWWTDLDPSRHGGTVFTLSSPTLFVVEWNSPVYGEEQSDNNAHFQIVLNSDGALQYNYQHTPSALGRAPVSVGAEGSVPEAVGSAQRGMSVSYNQPTVIDGESSVYFSSECIG